MNTYATEKIGLSAYLLIKGIKLVRAEVKNRNRATFVFEQFEDEVAGLEQDYLCSDHSKFFEAFKHLRELTIKNAK